MPMPSFFEMLGENSACYLRNIAYAQVCLLFIDAGDADSFADARRRLICQARAFADISRPIGERHILDLERASRLDAEAHRLHLQLAAVEGEAAELRGIIERAPR